MNLTKVNMPDGDIGNGFALMGIPIFHNHPAPGEAREKYEKPVCRRSGKCADCPYSANGFICWHNEEQCLRTDMEKISEKEKKRRNGRNHL